MINKIDQQKNLDCYFVDALDVEFARRQNNKIIRGVSAAPLLCSQFSARTKMQQIIDRRVNQSVMINGCIEVKVVEVNQNRVVLSVHSPDEVPPFREITFDLNDETSQLVEMLVN